jgi:hypothetical protein
MPKKIKLSTHVRFLKRKLGKTDFSNTELVALLKSNINYFSKIIERQKGCHFVIFKWIGYGNFWTDKYGFRHEKYEFSHFETQTYKKIIVRDKTIIVNNINL